MSSIFNCAEPSPQPIWTAMIWDISDKDEVLQEDS